VITVSHLRPQPHSQYRCMLSSARRDVSASD